MKKKYAHKTRKKGMIEAELLGWIYMGISWKSGKVKNVVDLDGQRILERNAFCRRLSECYFDEDGLRV